MAKNNIPFVNISYSNLELKYVKESLNSGQLAGNGQFSKRCTKWLREYTGTKTAMLVTSGTAALEMSALLLDLKPGDEIIIPSFTFVSTANAFVIFGAVPVFIDIRFDTLNLDETLLAEAITERTKAIVPVHYAGVSCEMDSIMNFAQKHDLVVIEDAAQGLGSTYKNKHLGTLGHLASLSFHQTKNLTAGGEGGALFINDESFIERAEFVLEKGTNRKQFFQGIVDKYTWVDIGSSYVMSDLLAAFLYGQLERISEINHDRMNQWQIYHAAFEKLEKDHLVRRPNVPNELAHNAHIYYLLLNSEEKRNNLLHYLNSKGINAVFHYIPLHNSPAGKRFGRIGSRMINTENLSNCLIRLPIWAGLNSNQQEYIISEVYNFFKTAS